MFQRRHLNTSNLCAPKTASNGVIACVEGCFYSRANVDVVFSFYELLGFVCQIGVVYLYHVWLINLHDQCTSMMLYVCGSNCIVTTIEDVFILVFRERRYRLHGGVEY